MRPRAHLQRWAKQRQAVLEQWPQNIYPISPSSNWNHSIPVEECECVSRQRTGSTTPTLFTPLQARYTRPSDVAAMFRTVPPPEGIFVRANSSVFGLKRMRVFGVTPDSLYQTMPSGVIVIPFLLKPPAPGDGHILAAPDTGSRRPSFPPW